MGDLKKELIKKLTALLSLASILTLMVTVFFGIMVYKGKIDPKSLDTAFMMIIQFYFVKKIVDKGGGKQ